MTDRSPAQKGFDIWGEDLFYKIVDLHLMFGYIIATPDYFVMGRPVPRGISHKDMIDITKTYPVAECDAWCIYFYSGNMQKVFSNLPFSLPYVVFERNGNSKIYLLDKLKQRISRTYGLKEQPHASKSTSPRSSTPISR